MWRAQIVLLSADGLGPMSVMRHLGKSKPTVRRWRARLVEEGVEGLLRDKSRPARIAPRAAEVVDRVVTTTLEEPLGEATHWTVRGMAE